MPTPKHACAALLAAACVLAGAFASPAAGQNTGPCAYQEIDSERWGHRPFRNPPEIRSRDGRIDTTLVVRYTDPAKTSIAGCPVKIRSYNGGLVGPTLRLRPGEDLRLMVHNRLPAAPADADSALEQQTAQAFIVAHPHSYNTTNFHTHGLHVSPSGRADNVLRVFLPQSDSLVDVPLPDDHTRGTYWYHAHAHGSTAIQVGSGMAGALIVEDDLAALPPSLRAATEREKVMVFQTILYDTKGEVEEISAFFPDPVSLPAVSQACTQGLSTCTWQGSKRRVLINGQIVPVITMRPGEVQRWRLIDAAFRESVLLQLTGHDLHEIATDGIYMDRVVTWPEGTSVELQPGYRSDVLVKASATPGTYPLLDAAITTAGLRGVAEDQNVVALVVVEDAQPLHMELPTDAEMRAIAPFAGVNLALEADGVQEATFKIGSGMQPGEERTYFQVNGYSFSPGRVRYVELGKTEMWSLATEGDPAAVQNGIPPLPHVFHIHINPFQVVRKGPNGQAQTVWKDTQLVSPGEPVNIYTRYLDYTGAFVMHCHILDHEDLGMMEVVEVVKELPLPGSVPTHHGHH